jgi:hypothetical protein
MVFSQRNTLDYQRFQRYAAKIKAGEGAYPSNAAWDHIDLRAITSRPHSSNYDGLLAADYVASSFGAALERNLYGASDEHFVRELRRIIYRPKGGSPWTNGLKVFPPQAETLPETHPRMRWIQSFFDYRKRARA